MATEKPSTFRKNRHLFLALALVLAMAGAFVFVLLRRDIRLPEAPLANVPRSASGVLYVRPDPVLRSPWLRPVFAERGVDAALENVRQRCGLDPAQQVQDLIVFVEGDDPSALEHLGVVARGPSTGFEHEKLGRCFEQAFREDSLGAMRRIEIDGVPAVQPERGNTRAAFLGRRGIVVGTLALVRQMIGTIRDHHGSKADDATLARLWSRVAPGHELVLVGNLPGGFRALVARAIGSERAAPILSAVSGLRSLGLGARVSSGLGLGTVLAFDSPASATAFSRTLGAKLDELKESILLAFTPFGGIVRRIQTEQHEGDVVITVDVPQENLERAIAFATGLGRRGQGNPLGALGAAPSAEPARPAIGPSPATATP